VGYRYPSASLLYAFTATQRLDATLSINAARIDAPEARVQNDTAGAQLGFRFRVSERFDLEGRTGRSHTSARGRSDIQQSFFGAVSWHDELSRHELSLSRDVEPSGRGVLVSADDLHVGYSRQLSERLTLDTSARVSRRDDLQFDLRFDPRRNEYLYTAGTLALAWKMDDSWTLGFAALYARQEHELDADAADGRRIRMSLEWRPQQ
jgi:hypothetical protein